MNEKKIILVVEDEYIQGSLLVASLQNNGAIVYWAQTIEEAKRIFMARNGFFDAILLDGCLNS
jgi:DNA-binding response OmpR family regulator